MKVKFTWTKDHFGDFTTRDLIKDKIYEVQSIEHDWYRIIDESEEDYMYPPQLFEIVESDPPAPVLM
ncbi:MAG: hypothetical protein IJ563_03520 [Selenomonadaceae bacterium]|nr:hypothetical protein [Selenomonadaceae bacterium]MBR1858848.1 hypothetical protein [Selenomonadaceae bacterium]